MKISVILVRYPDSVPIYRTLNCLCRQGEGVEILSVFAIEEKILKEYENLRICSSINEALEIARGDYIFFMHPEGVLALSALKRLKNSVGGRVWVECNYVKRYDEKDFLNIKDIGYSVYASLFEKNYLKKIISENVIEETDIELIPNFFKSDEKISLNEILVYFDIYTKVSCSTLEDSNSKVNEYTNVIRKNFLKKRNSLNYNFFEIYILKYFKYFNEIIKTKNNITEALPLFKELSEFVRMSYAHSEFYDFVSKSIMPIDINFFNKPLETVLKIPNLDILVKEESRVSVQGEFANGRAGMKILIQCFIIWLKVKLKIESK